jgi:PD-(D/E)XK nuclease superfamily protein
MKSTQLGDSESSRLLPLHKLANDKAFVRLDRSLRRFNIFEAIGAVRQELRHSDFLAFLLHPYSSHGLKGRFAAILLEKIAKCTKNKTHWRPLPTKFETLNTAEVRREWRNIDILLRFRPIKLALIIENKIDSSERAGQLEKYWETVSAEYPGWEIRGIYLTPRGDEPGNPKYCAVGYESILGSLERLLKEFPGEVTGDFRAAVKQYSAMIKQKIIPHLEDECWKIYTKYKPAFDLIDSYVHDSNGTGEYLEALIQQYAGLKFDNKRPGYVQFISRQWEKTNFLKSKRRLEDIMFFEFQYQTAQRAKGSLVFLLVINNKNNGREPAQAFNRAKQIGAPFRVLGSLTKWPVIFSEELIGQEYMSTLEPGTQQKMIARRWNELVDQTLPSLEKAIGKYFTA